MFHCLKPEGNEQLCCWRVGVNLEIGFLGGECSRLVKGMRVLLAGMAVGPGRAQQVH